MNGDYAVLVNETLLKDKVIAAIVKVIEDINGEVYVFGPEDADQNIEKAFTIMDLKQLNNDCRLINIM